MLELEFRHDHSIRSKCLKWVVRKILPTLQKMHIYCKRCNKHTGNTFPKKIILVSENEIKGKSRCAICFTEKTFIDDIKKNSFKGIDIYYINYIQENINSSNPLRIKINSATGYFKEKFLIQQNNMKVSGQKLDQKLKELMVEKKFFMKQIIVKLASILKMIYS